MTQPPNETPDLPEEAIGGVPTQALRSPTAPLVTVAPMVAQTVLPVTVAPTAQPATVLLAMVPLVMVARMVPPAMVPLVTAAQTVPLVMVALTAAHRPTAASE
uniref:Uncharacterized protein n=1 Tax=Janibacter limosus TaxID=53458 RepID=A0AC61U3E7_9MICO|nr:hypothetical protein [Janibacter limosus]